jgi:hypothetical protein
LGAVDSGKSVLLAKLALHLGVVTPAGQPQTCVFRACRACRAFVRVVNCVVDCACTDLESARQECSNFGWSAPGADYVRLSEQLPRAFKSADHDACTSFLLLLPLSEVVVGYLATLTMWLPCNRLHADGDRPHAIGHDTDQSSLPWLPQSM